MGGIRFPCVESVWGYPLCGGAYADQNCNTKQMFSRVFSPVHNVIYLVGSCSTLKQLLLLQYLLIF